MSEADARRQPLALRSFTTALAADLLVASVLGAGTVAALILTSGRWLGLAGLVIGAVLIVLRFPRQADPEDPREAIYRPSSFGRRLRTRNGFGGLGRLPGLRMLAVGLMLVLAGGRTGVIWAGLAAALLVLTIAAEIFVVRLLRLPAPYAVRLPGLPALPARTGVAWLPALVVLLATVIAAAAGVLGAPGWMLLVIAVLGGVPAAVVVLQVRSRRRTAARVRARLPKAIELYAPEFVLYTARPDDASYQLSMWLPYLERADRRFLIVTRNELPAEAIAAKVRVPVVCCRAAADLDLIMTESLRAAFYVNASSGNGALIRYHQLTHVYLGHGDSDKPPSYNPTHAMYDRIFTAGPAANRRYGDHGVLIDDSKFRVVGRPQVEAVMLPDPARVTERVAGARPVILYAPTWKGHVSETALSSLDRAESIIPKLLERDADVIFRPHPFSYDDPTDAAIIGRLQDLLADDARRNHRNHRYGPAAETELDAFGCMNAADVMISDVSSVVSDFLQSGKPYAMIAPPQIDADRFVADYPVARAGYLVDHELRSLSAVLDDLLTIYDDRLAPVRAEVRADYLGPFPVDGYADHFTEAVRDACDSPAPRVADVAESDDGSTTVSRDTIRRNLDSLARSMISGLAAIVALAAAVDRVAGVEVVAGVDAAAVVGAIAATVALVVMTVTLPRWRAETGAPTLDGPRMIMVLAGAAGLSSAGPIASGALLLVAVLGIAAEQAVRDAWCYPGVVVTELPELLVPIRNPVLGLLFLAPAVIGWLAWLPVIAGVGWPALAMLVIMVGWLVWLVIALATARSRLAAAARAEAAVPAALAQYAPEFCVYFGSGIGADYQVGMWLPYFRRLQRRFVIITRSRPMQVEIERLTAGTGIPVLFRPTLRSLEDVVVPSMRVAYYVNNAVRNTHLIERRELTHVWLNHGDSEKPACYNPVHAIYDLIFTAGQAGIDRYARHNVNIPSAKFRIVGRPQTELITQPQTATGRVEHPTVLYAPTWQGPYADSRVYSLPIGLEIIEALLARGVRVVFRAHPFNYRFAAGRKLITDIGARLEIDRRRTGVDHLWARAAETEMSVEDCFNASDAMICDVSAVISDYLASSKPFAVVAIGRTEDELVTETPAAVAGYPIAEDLHDLSEALDRLLVSDPKAADRGRMRRYYLGDQAFEHAAEGFLRASADLLDCGGADPGAAELDAVLGQDLRGREVLG